MQNRPLAWFTLVPLLAACSIINDFSIGDAGWDGGATDASTADARVDSGRDAGTDAGGVDAAICPAPCVEPTPFCDPTTRTCVECFAHGDCDDGNWCTTDRCDLRGRCEHVVEPTCVAGVSAGSGHTCAWLASGDAYCWGNNFFGQLGNGLTRVDVSSTPTAVMSLTSAIDMAGSDRHTCALRSDFSAACWGINGQGQLGDGTMVPERTAPALVSGIRDGASIAAGLAHTCALLSSGEVWCWGYNGYGQLGSGDMDDRNVPVVVVGLDDIVEITLGRRFSCARRPSGSIACWGEGFSGQLGNGMTADRSAPVDVLDIVDATQLDAGWGHVCAVHRAGQVACWGWNRDRQLGDGSTTDSSRPVAVPGLEGIVEVQTGEHHTCARSAEGAVSCWGSNRYGQLGDGTTSERVGIVPTGIADAQGLSLGNAHGCAIRGHGSLVCWGTNFTGELGDGTMVSRSTPVPVMGL